MLIVLLLLLNLELVHGLGMGTVSMGPAYPTPVGPMEISLVLATPCLRPKSPHVVGIRAGYLTSYPTVWLLIAHKYHFHLLPLALCIDQMPRTIWLWNQVTRLNWNGNYRYNRLEIKNCFLIRVKIIIIIYSMFIQTLILHICYPVIIRKLIAEIE